MCVCLFLGLDRVAGRVSYLIVHNLVDTFARVVSLSLLRNEGRSRGIGTQSLLFPVSPNNTHVVVTHRLRYNLVGIVLNKYGRYSA